MHNVIVTFQKFLIKDFEDRIKFLISNNAGQKLLLYERRILVPLREMPEYNTFGVNLTVVPILFSSRNNPDTFEMFIIN